MYLSEIYVLSKFIFKLKQNVWLDKFIEHYRQLKALKRENHSNVVFLYKLFLKQGCQK